MNSITAPIISVTVIEFIEPLTVFAHGVKLHLLCNHIEFTCNYNYPPFLTGNNEENREEYLKTFYPGKILRAEAYLRCTAVGHGVTPIPDDIPLGITEVAQLDWEVVGKVGSEPCGDEILIDCGFPLVAFADSFLSLGRHARWKGELVLL